MYLRKLFGKLRMDHSREYVDKQSAKSMTKQAHHLSFKFVAK